MVKHPQLYFDKTVRLVARYQMATEGQYLNDDKCPLNHDHQIGAGHEVPGGKRPDTFNTEIQKVGSNEYGGRAIVTVVGRLRNASRRDFVWYQYRFDIATVENISPVIVPYAGELQAGITYQADARSETKHSVSLIPQLKLPEHYATRIEWLNLRSFPELRRRDYDDHPRRIVFSVLSDDIRQVTSLRWNRTLRCMIIRVEQVH
jgi:hypothetical protein